MLSPINFTDRDQAFIDRMVNTHSHEDTMKLYRMEDPDVDVYDVLQIRDDYETALGIVNNIETTNSWILLTAPDTPKRRNIFARNVIRWSLTDEAYRGIQLGRRIASQLLGEAGVPHG